jgi:hypothetical protein
MESVSGGCPVTGHEDIAFRSPACVSSILILQAVTVVLLEVNSLYNIHSRV